MTATTLKTITSANVSKLEITGDPDVFYNVIEDTNRYAMGVNHPHNSDSLTTSMLSMISKFSEVEIHSLNDILVTFEGNQFLVVKELECMNISKHILAKNGNGHSSVSFDCWYLHDKNYKKAHVVIPDAGDITKIVEQVRYAGIMVSEFGIEYFKEGEKRKSWIKTLLSFRDISDRLSYSIKKDLADDHSGLYDRKFSSYIRKNATAIYAQTLAAVYTQERESTAEYFHRPKSINAKVYQDGPGREQWRSITSIHDLYNLFKADDFDVFLNGREIILVPSSELR